LVESGLFNGLRRIQIKFLFFHFHVSQSTSIGDSILSLSEAAGCGCWPATEKTYSMNSEFWKQLGVGIVRVPIPTESTLSYGNRVATGQFDAAARRRPIAPHFRPSARLHRCVPKNATGECALLCSVTATSRAGSSPFSSIPARFRIETQSAGPVSTQSGARRLS
jgi:hypothetical protein